MLIQKIDIISRLIRLVLYVFSINTIVAVCQRIKSNQIHKLLREEKEILVEQVGTIQHQVEAQNVVVRKLEEKERVLQNNLNTVEKELRYWLWLPWLGYYLF